MDKPPVSEGHDHFFWIFPYFCQMLLESMSNYINCFLSPGLTVDPLDPSIGPRSFQIFDPVIDALPAHHGEISICFPNF